MPHDHHPARQTQGQQRSVEAVGQFACHAVVHVRCPCVQAHGAVPGPHSKALCLLKQVRRSSTSCSTESALTAEQTDRAVHARHACIFLDRSQRVMNVPVARYPTRFLFSRAFTACTAFTRLRIQCHELISAFQNSRSDSTYPHAVSDKRALPLHGDRAIHTQPHPLTHSGHMSSTMKVSTLAGSLL